MHSKRLVLDDHLRVMQWVAPRINESLDRLVPGVAIGLEQNGQLVAGAVFNRITSWSAEFHLAAAPGKNWGTRAFFRLAAQFPFVHLGLNRVSATVREDNRPARRLAEHMGFKCEGVMRQACKDGSNMLMYGLLKDECSWAKP